MADKIKGEVRSEAVTAPDPSAGTIVEVDGFPVRAENVAEKLPSSTEDSSLWLTS